MDGNIDQINSEIHARLSGICSLHATVSLISTAIIGSTVFVLCASSPIQFVKNLEFMVPYGANTHSVSKQNLMLRESILSVAYC